MLCDKLLGKWMSVEEEPPRFDEESEEILRKINQEGFVPDKELAQAFKDKNEHRFGEVNAYLKKWEESIHFSPKKLPLSYIPDFQEKLKNSQKFHLTDDFAAASLSKMATPETVIKAKEWFKLIHNPMWIEWNYHEKLKDYRMGVLFWGEEDKIMCYSIGGVHAGSQSNIFGLDLSRIYPETVRLEGDNYTLDIEDINGGTDTEEGQGFLAKWAYDFIIRLNSPRITHFNPPADMTKINRKRTRLGRMPLCVYQTVDLTKEIKAYLKGDNEHSAGVRFHWRKGHFKVCRTGIFWWNPHTAGRKQYGEVVKEYVA